MNILTTLCKRDEANPDLFKIYWRNGAKKQGLLYVTVNTGVNGREIIAELSALQWLLGHRSVFGVTQTGKGLQLTVTAGAIKKMVKAIEKSGSLSKADVSKPHLLPYAKFLCHRFSGADVEVSKDESWVMPRAQNDIEEVVINEPLPEVIEIPSIGLVEISDHAIEQYSKRLASAPIEDTWRLFRQATMGNLRCAKLGKEYYESKEAKHGTAGDLWVNDELKWGFVVVPGLLMPRIVTAYAIKKMSVADRV